MPQSRSLDNGGFRAELTIGSCHLCLQPDLPACLHPPLVGQFLMAVSQFKIRVRYAETDQMGVVYHANYFVWFEVGRVELMRQLGLAYKAMEGEDGCRMAVIEASCRYRAPARYDDELLLESSVTALRRSVLKFGYKIFRREQNGQNALLAEGETTHVAVNAEMEKIALPERYAIALREFMERPPAATAAGSPRS